VAVGSLDLPALEIDEPDLELSAVVRLSVKRAFDFLLSLTALLLLSPVLVLIAALIKLSGRRADLLRTAARRPARPDVPHAEVPVDGGPRGAAAAQAPAPATNRTGRSSR